MAGQRLTKKQVNQIKDLIRFYRVQKLSDVAIAAKLNEDGYRLGKSREFKRHDVYRLGRNLRPRISRMVRRSGVVLAATSRGDAPDTVYGIMTDPVLNDTQRVRMLAAYYNITVSA